MSTIIAGYFAFLFVAWWVFGGVLIVMLSTHLVSKGRTGKASLYLQVTSLFVPSLAVGAAVAYMLYTQCYVVNVMAEGVLGKSGVFSAVYGLLLGVVPAAALASGIWWFRRKEPAGLTLGVKCIPLVLLPLFYSMGFGYAGMFCGK